MALSAQRHHKMVDQYERQHLPGTTIDWGCVYADTVDTAQRDVSCSTAVKRCKNKAPVSERSSRRARLSPAFIHWVVGKR